MKKQFIIGFVSGAVLFGAIGALAGQYTATDNPFPVKLNGHKVDIEGYNIEGSTFFKLRDIADIVGGFDVGFENSEIILDTKSDTSNTETPSTSTPTPQPTETPAMSQAPTPEPVATLSPQEELMMGSSLEDVIVGKWQHNSSYMGSYFILTFKKSEYSNFVAKNAGSRLYTGQYEIHGNKVKVTYYEDIANTIATETVEYTYKNGRLYQTDNPDIVLRKMFNVG